MPHADEVSTERQRKWFAAVDEGITALLQQAWVGTE